jgi:DnaJ domain
MADPKDKSAGQAPGTPAVPAIPRLTPATPEPVDPKASAPAAPTAASPPLAGPAPPQIPQVPRVAPLVTPSAAPRPAGLTPPPRARPGGLTPPPAARPPGLTPPPAARPPGLTPPPLPRPAGLAPPASTSTGRTGSFPAVPAVAPMLSPPGAFKAPLAAAAPSSSASEERVELERRFAVLEQLDYFEVMGLASTATPADIKRAFHHQSRTYHPDRFFQSTDAALRDRVNTVYKRVTEAYYVLRDDTRRRKYLADITGPDRLQKLRFDELAEAEAKAAVKKEVAEQIGTHPKGRQFFQAGLADLEAGRLAAAERNIKLALTYEPANPLYLQKLEEARTKSHEEFKRSGRGFRIE